VGGKSDRLLANVTNTLYFPDGSVKETNGDQTYRTTSTYDYAGRKKTLSTYRISGVADTTTWNYESWSGRLSSKLDAALRGPSYTYTSAGRPQTRTWARGYRTRYDYVSGRLTATRYFTSAASNISSPARTGLM
jgi:hypothetical protein